MKTTKIIEGFRGSVDLPDVPVGRNYRLRKKKILNKLSHIGSKYRQ